MKITKVYTRHGDKGMTDLVGGERVSKASRRLEAYGTVDELNSHLGLLIAMLGESADKNTAENDTAGTSEDIAALTRIQSTLFNVCTNLATDQSTTPLYPSAHIPAGAAEFLEQQVDAIQAMLPEKQGFILPGGCTAAAQCHVCRTVCRRAERCIVALGEVAEITPEVLQYVNRLSDYLFVLAKKINFNEGINEKIWENPCK